MQYFLIILSALLMALSQQPIGCHCFSWFALFPLINFLDKSKLLKEKFYASIIWGIVYHSAILYWMIFNLGTTKLLGFVSLVLATFVLSVNTILICLLYHIISKYECDKIYYTLPIIWVSIEYLRTF